MMWVLVLNGLVYLGFVYLHGEWRDLVPRRGDLRDAREMLRFYLFVRKDPPAPGQAQCAAKGRLLSHAHCWHDDRAQRPGDLEAGAARPAH